MEAIEQLAPFVKNGNMLLFTDDLPLSPVAKTITAFSALSNNKVKLNAIILPKTCNFGGNDPSGWLPYRFLSFITGGIYQTVTPDKTALALQIVFNEMQAQTQLNTVTNNTTNTSASAIQGTTVVANPIIVDDSVIKMNVLLNILSGGFTLNLIRPDGTVAAPTDVDVTYIDSGSAQYYEIATPKPGTWQASVNGQGEYKLSTSADTSIQFAYFGDTRGAPNAPIELVASLSGPVASSTFVIEQQNGQEVATVMLHDDGQQNDFVAGDNLYSGWYIPAQLGDFHLRVSGTTTSGQNFNRVDSRLIRIQGLRVIAPPSVLIANGASQELRFQVTNLDNISQIYQLSVTSDNGWIEQFPPQSITLAAGSTAEILVIIRIPTDAAANSVDKIWLTAIKQSDGTIIAEDNTLIFTPDANSPELSHLPGDCNADQAITASDVTALALEFFDGDDNSNPLATSGGAYAGSPACDANEDRQIGASDVTCIARLFFNGAGACRLAADATVATQPVLSMPSQIAAETNSQVTVPIELRSNGSAVGSLLFSVDYDETTLTFDPADHDQDGIPDAITFHLPAQMLRSVSFDPTDHTGELDLMLADFAATPAALPTGPLVSITLKTGAVAELTTAVVKFADRPAPSFGGIDGQNLAGASEGGTIFIHGPTDLLVLPLKNYLPLVVGQE